MRFKNRRFVCSFFCCSKSSILKAKNKKKGRKNMVKKIDKKDSGSILEDDVLAEETQPGVVVYRDVASAPEESGIVDMDVADGIKEVTIKYDLLMAESKKSFPDVEKLVIGEEIFSIEIPNTLFPNVKFVVSKSYEFESGPYLVRNYFCFMTLMNTFCRKNRELIDLRGINSIEDYAFKGCNSINVAGGEDIKNNDAIEPNAFSGSALEKQPFRDGIKRAGCIIFAVDYDAEEINIPDDKFRKVIFASDVDFSRVKKLVIHRPETVEQINYQLGFPETLVLETDLSMMEQDVARVAHFCTTKYYIKNFSVSSPEFMEIDGIAYTRNGKKLVACSAGKEHVVIPDGVKTIGKYAFANCRLKSVVIPDSVTAIKTSAFSECKNLESVVFGKNLEAIGDDAFESCVNLKSLTLPESVLLIGDYAFLRAGLEDIQLNEGLTYIGRSAFACTQIKTLSVPASIADFRTDCIGNEIEEVVAPLFREDIPDSCIKNFRPIFSNDTILKLQCGDRYLYIPRYMKPLTINDGLSSIEDYFTDPNVKTPDIWSYAYTTICKENMAFLEYTEFHTESAKKYLKQNSKKIASRFVHQDNEESTITLVKTGLVSKKALRELLEKAKEKNMTILQSYILQQLNADGISKRDFHI